MHLLGQLIGVLCTAKPLKKRVYAARMLSHPISSKAWTLISQKKRSGKLQSAAVTKHASNRYPLEGEMQTSFWTLASGLMQNKAVPARENSFPGVAFQGFEGFSVASSCGGEVGILFCFVFVFRFHLLNNCLLLPTMCRVPGPALMIQLWIRLGPRAERSDSRVREWPWELVQMMKQTEIK